MNRTLTYIITIILALGMRGASFAQSPEITSGLNYLTSTQNADGSWGGETSATDNLPATAAVVTALGSNGQTSTVPYTNALNWLSSQNLDTTDYLAERIYTLSTSGTDKDILLQYSDYLYHAWGGYSGYDLNNLDTALALQALKAVNYADLDLIGFSLGYLTLTQNPDGGWGFYQGTDSNVYMTAMVSRTLQQFPQSVSTASSINKATSYILAHQWNI